MMMMMLMLIVFAVAGAHIKVLQASYQIAVSYCDIHLG